MTSAVPGSASADRTARPIVPAELWAATMTATLVTNVLCLRHGEAPPDRATRRGGWKGNWPAASFDAAACVRHGPDTRHRRDIALTTERTGASRLRTCRSLLKRGSKIRHVGDSGRRRSARRTPHRL